MQTQPPPATPTTEKLFLTDKARPVRSEIDPNGALWSLVQLARKFEELTESGALQMAPPTVKDVCDYRVCIAMIAQSLGLECSLHPDMLGALIKLWDERFSSRLKSPMKDTNFIGGAYNLIQQHIAQSLNRAATN